MTGVNSVDLLVWLTRALLFIVFALLFALAALPLVVIVRPVVTEALRARTAGDWWLPFLPDEKGGHGPLAANHWWSVFRASARGTTGSLLWRWGPWVLLALGVAFTSAVMVVSTARLLRLGWI